MKRILRICLPALISLAFTVGFVCSCASGCRIAAFPTRESVREIIRLAIENHRPVFARAVRELERLPADTHRVVCVGIPGVRTPGAALARERTASNLLTGEAIREEIGLSLPALESLFDPRGPLRELGGLKYAVPHDGWYEFVCHTAGISISGGVYGVYYASDDAPKLVWAFGELVEKDGVWICASEGAGDRYQTRRVCEHFFYYEYHT